MHQICSITLLFLIVTLTLFFTQPTLSPSWSYCCYKLQLNFLYWKPPKVTTLSSLTSQFITPSPNLALIWKRNVNGVKSLMKSDNVNESSMKFNSSYFFVNFQWGGWGNSDIIVSGKSNWVSYESEISIKKKVIRARVFILLQEVNYWLQVFKHIKGLVYYV